MSVARGARTSAEVWLDRWMRFSLLSYAGTTLVFLGARSTLFDSLNAIGAGFGLPPTPPSSELFWFALSISMMSMLCACCVMVIKDQRRHLDMCLPIVVGKFAGGLVGVLAFALWHPYPAHITIALTDVPMGLVTLALWASVRSRQPVMAS